jgi:hypothetical protein
MFFWRHSPHLTYCNFTESNLNFVISLHYTNLNFLNLHATLFDEHGLYRPLRSQVPNLMPIFLAGDISKKSVQFRHLAYHFVFTVHLETRVTL